MPGFVSDNAYGGSATGLKTYDIRNFAQFGSIILGLGTKSDGTGSKIFQKNIGVDSEWQDGSSSLGLDDEGTDDLIEHPFFVYLNGAYYPVKSGSATNVAKIVFNTYDGTFSSSWLVSQPTGAFGYTHIIEAFNGAYYATKGGVATGISQVSTSSVTQTVKSTAINPRSITSGDYAIGIAGTLSDPREARVLIWDAASLLVDQNVRLGSESVVAIGFPNSVYTTVSSPARIALETNGRTSMNVRVLSGETPQLIYRLESPTETNFAQHDINDYYQNAMLWYSRNPINSDGDEFVQGVWACGSGSANSQFGVSMLLDTSSLGLVERAKVFGTSIYFAHNSDGSVSRLDDFETGTFDIPGYIETLFYGADTPFQKQLEGVSVVTENLPSGGTVEVQYRTDENNTWTSLGTSDTDGKQVHNFTRANGTPIGKFREIQFKIILTGKIALKSYLVSITEEDDLPFNV